MVAAWSQWSRSSFVQVRSRLGESGDGLQIPPLANGCELRRTLLPLAMQKVVGWSPSIRFNADPPKQRVSRLSSCSRGPLTVFRCSGSALRSTVESVGAVASGERAVLCQRPRTSCTRRGTWSMASGRDNRAGVAAAFPPRQSAPRPRRPGLVYPDFDAGVRPACGFPPSGRVTDSRRSSVWVRKASVLT